MKLLASLVFAVPALAAAGEGILGTRAEVAPTSAGAPLGIMPILQMGFALLIVGGLVKWVMPRLLGKVNNVKGSADIAIKSTVAMGSGSLHIVETRGRTLLIGATANGMNCLADLTPIDFEPTVEVAEVAPVRDEFDSLLRQAAADMSKAAVRAPVSSGRVGDVELALARLSALED